MATFKKVSDPAGRFEPSHVAVIVHNRPISEEFVKEAFLDKMTQKISFKPYSNWLETSHKIKGGSTPASIIDTDHGDFSAKSKFKSKLLTARVTEEDISKQIGKNKSGDNSKKDKPLNELSPNSNPRKSGLSTSGDVTLLKNLDSTKPHELKSNKDSMLNKNGPRNPGLEPLITGSIIPKHTRSPKKDQATSSPPDSLIIPHKNSPERSRKTSIENGCEPQPTEVVNVQPKKLFQRREPQNVRSPLLFVKKLNGNFPMSISKAESSSPKIEGTNKEVESRSSFSRESKVDAQNEPVRSEKRRISLKKEHFHGVRSLSFRVK